MKHIACWRTARHISLTGCEGWGECLDLSCGALAVALLISGCAATSINEVEQKAATEAAIRYRSRFRFYRAMSSKFLNDTFSRPNLADTYSA
jgi:hypothetical protein